MKRGRRGAVRGDRPQRVSGKSKGRAKGARKDKSAVDAERQTVRHALFGRIPIIKKTRTTPGGKTYSYWEFDPAYRPPLPAGARGAVRGDITKQVYCCDIPKYFYLDEERQCVQCESWFVFRAAEQKYWYESLKFNFASVPIRCVDCRRQRRNEHALREQVARSRRAAEAAPKDAASCLALARALVELKEQTGRGSMNDAISSARRGMKLCPDCVDALFWEGRAQHAACRDSLARRAFARFVSDPQASRTFPSFVRHAQERLKRLG